MLKRLLVVAALAIVPAGCSSLGIGTPPATQPAPTPAQVTQAQRDLHVAELAYNGALKTIQVLVRQGVLKGSKAAAVQKAVIGAKAALDVARAAVDSGKVDMAVILTASTRVIELFALFKN